MLWVSRYSSITFFLYRRRKNHNKASRMAAPATPPTTPPAIAPVLLCEEPSVLEASVADDDAASVEVPEAEREVAVVATADEAVVCESESVVVVTVDDVAAEEILVVEDVASETSFAVFRLTPTSARFSAHPT